MRLKPIPTNTVVHTPTEVEAKELLAILHENGYKWPNHSKYSLLDMDWWTTDDMCYIIKPQAQIVGWNTRFSLTVHSLEKPTFITLAEFKERYVIEDDKPQPQFKVGDKVKVIEPNCWHSGQIGIVRKARTSSEQVMVTFSEGGAANFYSEECLEPYTEPETTKNAKEAANAFAYDSKLTKYMKAKDEAKEAKGGTKELNLCELLKGHEGERLFYTPMGDVIYFGIEINLSVKSIIIKQTRDSALTHCIRSDGRLGKKGECLLFPSRELWEQYPLEPYKAWMKWKEEQKKYALYIDMAHSDGKQSFVSSKTYYFRTPAVRDKCIEVIKAIIEKYSEK